MYKYLRFAINKVNDLLLKTYLNLEFLGPQNKL